MSAIVKSGCIAGIILYLVNDVSAFSGDARRNTAFDTAVGQLAKSRSRTKNGITMLVDPENPKQKIITPNDIASLFGGSKSSSSKSKAPSDYDDDEDFEYEMYDEEPLQSGDKQAGVQNDDNADTSATATASMNEQPMQTTTAEVAAVVEMDALMAPKAVDADEESATMRELFALQEMALNPVVSAQLEISMSGEQNGEDDFGDGIFMTSESSEKATATANEGSSAESELSYMNLERVLDKVRRYPHSIDMFRGQLVFLSFSS